MELQRGAFGESPLQGGFPSALDLERLRSSGPGERIGPDQNIDPGGEIQESLLAPAVGGQGADDAAGRVEERQGNPGAGRAVLPVEMDAQASGLPPIERDVDRRRGRTDLD